MEPIILTDGTNTIRIELSTQRGTLQLRAFAAGAEVGDARLVWSDGALWIEAWTADEIAEDVAVPKLDRRVLFALE